METNETKKRSWKIELRDWIIALAVAVGVALLLTQVIFVNAKVPSESMEPTIQTGDRVLGLRLAYAFSEPERLDIVIFRFPDDESQLFVKRVIGLPGDTVELRDGLVYLNGSETPLEEPYVYGTPDGRGDGVYVVPAGHYFMLGDNRNRSSDSRFWERGFVPQENIVGRAALRMWPSPGKLH